MTSLERSLASPYLSAGLAHSAGLVVLAPVSAQSIGFFRILGRLFPVHKNVEKTLPPRTPPNLKNQTPGYPKLDFGIILDDFWHHFFDQFS